MHHSDYDSIAFQFHRTRHALWPGVVQFLESIAPGSTILDVGCGNGKYLSLRSNDCTVHGCDASPELVKIARENHPNTHVIEANALKLPYKDNAFDAVMSVAVLHHMKTPEDRSTFISELQRVLKPNGRLLVTVWATSARKSTWKDLGNNDFAFPWSNSNTMRYYHLFTREELQGLFPDISVKITFDSDNWYAENLCHSILNNNEP